MTDLAPLATADYCHRMIELKTVKLLQSATQAALVLLTNVISMS